MRTHSRRIALIPSLALALAASALAAAPADKPAPNPNTEVKRIDVGGLQVAIDPSTGRLRQPTAAERRQMAREMARFLKRAPASLQAETHGEGMVSLDLGGSYLNVYLARINADGTVAEACFTDADNATAFLTGSSSAWEVE